MAKHFEKLIFNASHIALQILTFQNFSSSPRGFRGAADRRESICFNTSSILP
jgi:hypothetical protein